MPRIALPRSAKASAHNGCGRFNNAGTNQIVTVDIEQGQIKARVPTRLPVRIGETVGLAFQPEHLVVFDAATGRATQSALYEDNGHG